jgi:F-box and leucine-rich repeat protein 2/20
MQSPGIGGVHSLSCDQINSSNKLSICEGRKYLETLRRDCCEGITDIGVSPLGHACCQLQSIDLCGCHGLTDVGLSALYVERFQLQQVDVVGCQGISDIGVSVLGCGHLQSIINLNECNGITDIGISVLGHGCDQLQSIDVSGCQGITDIGVPALGHSHHSELFIRSCNLLS